MNGRQRLFRRQRGASMMFALIALAVLTLGGVALVRSVDTGMLTMGNLGFRKHALSTASTGTEAAMDYLKAQALAALSEDDAAAGYYATAVTNLAPMDTSTSDAHPVSLVDWDNDKCNGAATSATRRCLTPATATAGDVVYKYVVTRLCATTGGGGSSRPCVVPLTSSEALSMDRGTYSSLGKPSAVTLVTYYRIVVRAEAARGSVAYTETLVHF
jgi:Tfp pilus assembly protein PilX